MKNGIIVNLCIFVFADNAIINIFVAQGVGAYKQGKNTYART